jgi:hypothetical protein
MIKAKKAKRSGGKVRKGGGGGGEETCLKVYSRGICSKDIFLLS